MGCSAISFALFFAVVLIFGRDQFFVNIALAERRSLAIAATGAAPDYPIYRVRGNCDIGSDDPAEGLAPFGGVLFFYTHGHLFGVKSGYERIAEYAADRGADVVLFGHTHYKTLRHGTPFSPTLFNPGSLRDTHSYGVITITDGQCSFEWKQVPEQW